MCQCVQELILDKQSYLFICLFIHLITYQMYSSDRYIIYEFLFMCLSIYISACIKVRLSLFLSLCFSCILSWIICVEFVMSLNFHQAFGVPPEQ